MTLAHLVKAGVALILAILWLPIPPSSANNQGVELIRRIGLRDRPQSMAFTHDGTRLFDVRDSGIVDEWEIRTGKLLRSVEMGAVRLAISNDDAMLAVARGQTSSLVPPHYLDLIEIAPWQVKRSIPTGSCAYALRFSPDGNTLAAMRMSDVTFWNYRTGHRLRSITTHGDMGMRPQLAFSPDGSVLATAPGDNMTTKSWELWNVSSGTLHGVIASRKPIHAIAFAPDGRTMAAGVGAWPGDDLAVELWDVGSRSQKLSMPVSGMNITGVAFSKDGKSVSACDETGTVHRWSAVSGTPIASGAGGEFACDSIVSEDGRYVAVSGSDNSLRVYDTQHVTPAGIIPGDPFEQTALAFSADGTTLYQIGSISFGFSQQSNSGQIIAWDTRTGQVKAQLIGGTSVFRHIKLTAAGDTAAIVDDEGNVWIADMKSRRLHQILRASKDWQGGAIAISPDGSLLAVSSLQYKEPIRSGTGPLPPSVARLQLVSGLDGHVLQTWQPAASKCDALGFSADGKTLVSYCSGPGSLDSWDVATGHRRMHIGVPNYATSDISRDGKLAVVNSVIYDLQKGAAKRAVMVKWPNSCNFTFSPDSTVLIGMGDAGGGGIWDAATGRKLRAWDSLARSIFQPVMSPVLSPDGRILANLNPFGGIDLWSVDGQKVRTSFQAFGDSQVKAGVGEWLAWTPEGYFTGSAGVEKYLTWRTNGTATPQASAINRYRNPEKVQIALTGKAQSRVFDALAKQAESVRATALQNVRLAEAPYMAQYETKPAPPKTPTERLRNDLTTMDMLGDQLAESVSNKILEDLADGADPDTQGGWGTSPLMFFSYLGKTAAVKDLLARHVKLDLVDVYGSTALLSAAEAGRDDIVTLLINAGADFLDLAGHSLLHPRASREALSEELVRTFAKRDDRTSFTVDQRGRACLLVKLGADVNVRNKHGETPLLFAVFYLNDSPLFQELLAGGADLDARDDRGQTAVIQCSLSDSTATMQLLLSHGANANLADNDGFTALLYAAGRENPELVELLLDHGADPNIAADAREDHRTPLFFAADAGYYANVKELIAHKANVNVLCDGESALSRAVQGHDASIIKLLLDSGADPDLKLASKKTLLELARDSDPTGEFGIVALLTNAGKKH